jgi:predicted transposase/invertase (TIGR01784 family)
MPLHPGQTYGIPTYNGLFKWILSEYSIRPSFFHAFLPDVEVKSSKRLDEHMNALKEYQRLRAMLNRKETHELVKRLSDAHAFEVMVSEIAGTPFASDPAATSYLHDMLMYHEEMKHGLPDERFDGSMDFVCEINDNEYVLIEMQVSPHDKWDHRALGYAAWYYGNQMKRGDEWGKIRKVIAINILGGGVHDKCHWKDRPHEFMRHYKLQEQLHSEKRFIDGIEIFQYSLMNAPARLDELGDQERQDWVTFFAKAALMSPEQVLQQIKTPEVLAAFERASYKKMPKEIQSIYNEEDAKYMGILELTQAEREEGRTEGRVEGITEERHNIALKMLAKNKDDAEIMEFTELTSHELNELKQQKKGIE